MNVWEQSGVSRKISRFLRPIARKLFKTEDEKTLDCLCMNMSVNLLGISGAATPYGISAAQRLDKADNAEYSSAVLSRLARLCAELGVSYFCVPYFEGCERLKLEMKNGCKLQVFGVDNLTLLKKMHGAGVERVVTAQAFEMFSEWMKEVEKINFPELMEKREEKSLNRQIEVQKPVVTALRLPFPLLEPQKLIEEGKKNA